MRLCILAMLCSLAVACARPLGQAPQGRSAGVTVVEAQQGTMTGQRVRWGGDIVSVTPRKDQTCFEVIDRPLVRDTRPPDTGETLGRFVACARGFYDPAVYEHGYQLTVTGTLQAPVVAKVGEATYRYPRLAADHLSLWPSPERPHGFDDPWANAFWEPYWAPWTDTTWSFW